MNKLERMKEIMKASPDFGKRVCVVDELEKDARDKEEYKMLFELPNWDNEVFKDITGIDAEAEIAKE